MSRYVVDASIVVKWFLPEIHTEAANKLLSSVHQILAPDLVHVEVGNVLWKHVRRKELTARHAREFLDILLNMEIHIHSSEPLLIPAFDIATALDRSVYDCLYLSLAITQDCPLVTADRKLYNALKDGNLRRHVWWVENLPES